MNAINTGGIMDDEYKKMKKTELAIQWLKVAFMGALIPTLGFVLYVGYKILAFMYWLEMVIRLKYKL